MRKKCVKTNVMKVGPVSHWKVEPKTKGSWVPRRYRNHQSIGQDGFGFPEGTSLTLVPTSTRRTSFGFLCHSGLADEPLPSWEPTCGRNGYITPAFAWVPTQGQNQKWLPSLCLLRGKVIGQLHDGHVEPEYHRDGVWVVNHRCPMYSISFGIPGLESPPPSPSLMEVATEP